MADINLSIMFKYTSILAAVLFTGCVAVPSTRIKGNLKTGVFSIKAPKDYQIGTLHVSADTNGAVTVDLSQLSATNSPQVIMGSAIGQVDIINAVGAQVGNAAAMAVKAAVKP